MHFLELYSSDDRTTIERKRTFPRHNLSADRAPKRNLTRYGKDFDEVAADGALPLAWPPTGPIPWMGVCFPVGYARWGEMVKQTDFNC